MHSNFIDTVLLYRKVCSLLMSSRNTQEVLQKDYCLLLLAVDDRPEEIVSNSLILINNIMYYA